MSLVKCTPGLLFTNKHYNFAFKDLAGTYSMKNSSRRENCDRWAWWITLQGWDSPTNIKTLLSKFWLVLFQWKTLREEKTVIDELGELHPRPQGWDSPTNIRTLLSKFWLVLFQWKTLQEEETVKADFGEFQPWTAQVMRDKCNFVLTNTNEQIVVKW